jgi:uncharacterized protein (DUF362 family)
MASRSGMTRREILRGVAGAAAASSVGGIASCFPSVGGQWPDGSPDVVIDTTAMTCGCDPPDAGAPTSDDEPLQPVEGSSKVVTIQRSDSIDSKGKSLEEPYLGVVEDMVNALLSSLAGGADNPWSVILPDANRCSRIGLKVNCLDPYFPSAPAIVRAIIKSLVDRGGICPGNIVVWDRRLKDELQDVGGYHDTSKADYLQGARLLGTINSKDDSSGIGYSDRDFGTFEGQKPRLSRILLEQTDFTINLPVLKRHGESGVTAALKNIYGIIDIPGKYHGLQLQTGLPALYAIPAIRKSIKLTIVDALRAVVMGNTASSPDMFPGRIIGSLDPLALDYYARDLLNELRAVRKQGPLDETQLKWLENAYAAGLGAKSYELVDLSPGGGQADAGPTADSADAGPTADPADADPGTASD